MNVARVTGGEVSDARRESDEFAVNRGGMRERETERVETFVAMVRVIGGGSFAFSSFGIS